MGKTMSELYEKFRKDPQFEKFEKFDETFAWMARHLSDIRATNIGMDMSEKRELVEAHLNIGNGVSVTVMKEISTMRDSDDVFFTISYGGLLRVADSLPIYNLKERLSEFSEELKKERRT